MRALCVVRYGEPLEMLDLPAPAVRPGEALVEVLACGLCQSDVKTVRGRMPYSAELTLPHVPGHEMCGRVLEINARAGQRPRVSVGDRVVAYHVWACHDCAACRRGEEQLCTSPVPWMGFTHPGVFRELMAVPVEYLLPIPEPIPTTQAPALTCALGTAYRAVAVRARLLPGEVGVVLGLGGVGIHAALIGIAAGGRIIGVEGADKLARVRAAGVVDVVPAGADLVERLRDEVPEGADVVVETTGDPSLLEPARRLLRPGGRLVAVGYQVGAEMPVSSDQMVLLEQSLLGSRYASRADMERGIALVASGRVQPVIEEVLPFERANEAIERVEAGTVTGRLVLRLSGQD